MTTTTQPVQTPGALPSRSAAAAVFAAGGLAAALGIAVGELIAEAFPAPDGCQVITGISECILGAKLLAPWGARPECQAPLHD